MDRDGRGKPPSGEFSSFDLSKMSEAEVAAELAARMARWRRAHKASDNGASDNGTREPPAGKPTPQPPGPQPPAPPQLTAAEPPMPPHDAGLAIAARIARARRIAVQNRLARGRARSARQAWPYGTAFSSLLAEGPNMNAIGMAPENGADHAPPREWPSGGGAQELGIGVSRAPAMRALSSRLQAGIDLALTLAGALGAWIQEAGIAAWRRLAPALEARMHQAETDARAAGARARAAAREAWRVLAPALEAGARQALQRTHAITVAAHRAGTKAWHASGPLLRHGIDQAPRCARAIAAAAWQARTDRFVVAGIAAIAIAIAAWLVMMPSQPTGPDVARSPAREHPRVIPGASAALDASQVAHSPEVARSPDRERPRVIPGASAALDSSQVAYSPETARTPDPPPAPEARESNGTAAFLAPMLKPTPPRPTLAVRLKPARNTAAADRQDQSETQLQETGPLTTLSPTTQRNH